ncbi:hypothetical protein Dimus_036499, partial [Dionaea muscipula]
MPRKSPDLSPERTTISLAHELSEPVHTTALMEAIPSATVQPFVTEASGSAELGEASDVNAQYNQNDNAGTLDHANPTQSSRGEAWRASLVEIPSSLCLIPLHDSLLITCSPPFPHYGEEEKEKTPLIPWSQWTPVVQGLIPNTSDTSFETTDFEPPLPMEPIEEDDEEMSEDDNSSSIGGSNASAASIDDVFAQRDDVPASTITDSGICQGPDLLGFPDLHDSLQIEDDAVQLRLQKDTIGPLGSHQQNPNDLIPPMEDFDLATEPTSAGSMCTVDLPLLADQQNPNQVHPVDSSLSSSQQMQQISDLGMKTLTSEFRGQHSRQPMNDSCLGLPPSSCHAPPAQDGIPTSVDNDNSKSQWSHLFANNQAKCPQMQHGPAPAAKTKPHIWRPKRMQNTSAWRKISPTETAPTINPSIPVAHTSYNIQPIADSSCPVVQDPGATIDARSLFLAPLPYCSSHPTALQGLSVEFKYPSSEEDNCSLHTIDEEEREDSPDSRSNPSDGDLSDEEQQFHEPQPMADLEIVKSGHSCQPPLPEKEFHPQQAPCEESTMDCHPELLLQMDSPSSPPSQRQIEEGQSSTMNRDCSRPSAAVINVNNDTREPSTKLQEDPSNLLLQQHVMNLKQQCFRMAEAERSFLAQKAKVHYFKNSDRSTAFFHALIRKKATKSHVASIVKPDGTFGECKLGSYYFGSANFHGTASIPLSTSYWQAGLSVEYTYPTSDEDDSSLHTIDEEDFEETLDLKSISSEGDLSDEGQLDRESQMIGQLHLASEALTHADCSRFEIHNENPPPILEVWQCSHVEDENTEANGENILDPMMNASRKLLSENDDVVLGNSKQPSLPDKDLPPINEPYGDSNRAIPLQMPQGNPQPDLNSKQIQHDDEGGIQPSGQQNPIESNCRRNLKKVWVPKNHETDATGHDDTLGNRLQADTDALNHIQKRQTNKQANQENSIIPIPDHSTNLRGVFMDATMNMVATCTDREEQQSLKDDFTSLQVATAGKSIETDGFQLFQLLDSYVLSSICSSHPLMRKKSRKKLGKWVCPGVVSGLSAEFVFSDEDDHEEDGSLHTIDEDDDEGNLEEASNPSENDVGDDLEQCSHPEENQSLISPLSADAIVDRGRNQGLLVNPLIRDDGMCSIDEQALDFFPKMLDSTNSSLTLIKSSSATLCQTQSEEGQPSMKTMDEIRSTEHDFPSSSCPRQSLDKATNTHVPQDKQENTRAGSPQDDHRETGQTSHACIDDQMDLNQMNSHDIPLENVASYSVHEEHHMLEDDPNCSQQNRHPELNVIDVSKENSSLELEGFQPVRKK